MSRIFCTDFLPLRVSQSEQQQRKDLVLKHFEGLTAWDRGSSAPLGQKRSLGFRRDIFQARPDTDIRENDNFKYLNLGSDEPFMSTCKTAFPPASAALCV